MRTLSEIIGLETITMAEPRVAETLPKGDPRGIKTTPEDGRVDLQKLENMYIYNPVMFNSINKIVQVIMSSGYNLVGDSASVAFIEEFIENIGKRGGSTDWLNYLETIFKHQAVYGRAFSEIIYNVEGTDILDLDFIDPKKMDYAKDGNQNIVFDKTWNPIGYVEKIPSNNHGTFVSDPIPNGVSIDLTDEIYFDKNRIAQFKLYTIGDSFYGLGIIEPAYQSSNRKVELERALANIYLKTAFPTKFAKVGDQFHEATDDMLQNVLKQLQETGYDSVHAFPSYVELGLLEPKSSEKLKMNLDYFRDNEVAATGMPEAFALGSGEATNRATLGRQEYLFKLGLRDMINRTLRTIETEIFSKIAYLNDLPEVPKILWNDIVLEELDSKASRLVKYVSSGLVTPDYNIEKQIRMSEGLPELAEDDFNAARKVKEKPTAKE